MRGPREDIQRRRPVWEAMSEFFLDTQIAPGDLDRIARVLRESGYSVQELGRILWHELCPVLWTNTIVITGAWAGFDMGEVEHRILKRPAGALRRWWSYHAGGRMARHDWLRVRDALNGGAAPSTGA